MTMQAVQPSDRDDAPENLDEGAAAIEAMAAEAEAAEQAEQAQHQAEEPEPGEWEDGEAQEASARALAAMGVKGVGMLAKIIHSDAHMTRGVQEEGVEALLPVARDFSGEVPEWLRPYMNYIGAGMWVGGVLIGAYQAKRAEQDEAERQEAEQARREAEGVPHGA